MLRSPLGEMVYPKVTEPDTKYKDEGEYSTKLRVPMDLAKPLMAAIDKEAAESLAAAIEKADTAKAKKSWETKYIPYEIEEDDDGEPTGCVLFKFSMKASGKSKKTGKTWTRKPALFDAKGTPLKNAQIWGGTTAKISFSFQQYAQTAQTGASVKMALEAVQVIDLVSGGTRSADAYGFDEEDGYEVVEEDQMPETDEVAAPAGSDSDDEDDF